MIASRTVAWTAVLLASLVLLSLTVAGVYKLAYNGQIYPGVAVRVTEAASVDVGGLDHSAALDRLSTALPNQPPLTLVIRHPGGTGQWTFSAAELGLGYDVPATADRAMEVGRSGSPLRRLFGPLATRLTKPAIVPVLAATPEVARAVLEPVSEAVAVPPVNARIERSNGATVAVEPQLGQALDFDATLAAVSEAAAAAVGGTVAVDARLTQTSPRVGSLENVAAAFELITSGPIALMSRGRLIDTISLDELSAWVTLEKLPSEQGDPLPSVVFDRGAILARVESTRELVRTPGRPTKYDVPVDNRVATVIGSGEPGVVLNAEASVDRVIDAAYSDARRAELAVRLTSVGLPPDRAGELDGVLEFTRAYADFLGQPPERIQNMTLAADRLDGVAIGSGETLSLAAVLGPMDSLEGIALAVLDPLESGMGGGVTEVATALYRAFLFAGLGIAERQPHPYRIAWIEPPVGLDATISPLGDDGVPIGPDLKLTNTTGQALLVRAGVDVERAAVEVRLLAAPTYVAQADLIGPTVTSIVEPRADQVLASPAVPIGRQVQTRWAREGATVTWERFLPDGSRESIQSRYEPVGNVVVVGTAE